ncbi:MAG: ChbG/HpnK family deacetylase [Acidimicrobiales bacterium]
MTRNRLLIVNADDYGLSVRTSHTIVELHEIGVVTSTSALVLAPGFAPTARLVAGHPTLGLGVHLCLVGPDPAVLSAREIPTLVGRRGRLAPSWHRLVPRLLAGRVDPADVERELAAQVEVALSHGLRPTHLDSHEHLHLWPGISTAVINVARRFAIPAVRCPESRSCKTERPPVSVMSALLRRELAAAGLVTTERFAGLDESGKAVAHRFDRVLTRVPPGVASIEFGVHPSVDDDPDRVRYPWRHRGTDEAAGLARWGLRDRLRAAGWQLGTFADLAAREHRAPPPPPTAPPLAPPELVRPEAAVPGVGA